MKTQTDLDIEMCGRELTVYGVPSAATQPPPAVASSAGVGDDDDALRAEGWEQATKWQTAQTRQTLHPITLNDMECYVIGYVAGGKAERAKSPTPE